MYIASDVAPKEVVWLCKNRQAEDQVMSAKWEMDLPGNILRTCMEICAVQAVAPIIIVHDDEQ
jgi:hypothetical protein